MTKPIIAGKTATGNVSTFEIQEKYVFVSLSLEKTKKEDAAGIIVTRNGTKEFYSKNQIVNWGEL